ncbi:MAG: hypothetical protein OSB47_16545, partial [Pirellulaceae bacterium]|nr:hypothetical protein [Pirellulaceae bacterium]
MNAATDNEGGRFSWLLSRRWWPSGKLARLLSMLVASLVVIVVLVTAWNRWGGLVTGDSQYRLQANCVEMTPQPSWIRSDIKDEVIQQGSLLSMP